MGRARDAIMGMSGRKGKLLLLAGLCVVVGVVLNAGSYFGGDKGIESSTSSSSSLRSDWTDNSGVKNEVQDKAQSWGDAAIRFGGSFMVAMIIGSLLREFVKTMVLVILLLSGVLWYLHYRGIMEPFWEDAFHSWDHAKDWILVQTRSAKDFLQGYVPSMTSALVGLGFGLKK